MNDNTQVMVNQMTTMAVTVLSLNIFAQALGILVAAAVVTKPPEKLTATEQGIADLREAYGSAVVDRALKEVPSKKLVELAHKIETLMTADMVSKYGEFATMSAIKAAPPGDLRTAREIAAVLSGQGITPATPTYRVADTTNKAKTRAMAGRKPGKPVLDTKTNIQYKSKSAAGRAVAAEYGLDPNDHFVWYAILEKDPKRFKEV